MKGLVWFREDLRLYDNSALYHAAQQCEEGSIGVYIIDAHFWKKHSMAACRVQFLLTGLFELSQSLQSRGISLLIKSVKKTIDIPKVLYQCMKKYKLEVLFFNKQYEIDEKQRDKIVCNYLNQYAIKCNTYDDQVILPPGTIQTKQGKTFSIFTPYKRAYLQLLLNNQNIVPHYSLPKSQHTLDIRPSKVPQKLANFSTTIIWPSGEKAVLNAFSPSLKV